MNMPTRINTNTISFAGDLGNRKIDSSLVDYVDILFNLMDVDITYKKFQSMNENERSQFVRDLKINKIINE